MFPWIQFNSIFYVFENRLTVFTRYFELLSKQTSSIASMQMLGCNRFASSIEWNGWHNIQVSLTFHFSLDWVMASIAYADSFRHIRSSKESKSIRSLQWTSSSNNNFLRDSLEMASKSWVDEHFKGWAFPICLDTNRAWDWAVGIRF